MSKCLVYGIPTFWCFVVVGGLSGALEHPVFEPLQYIALLLMGGAFLCAVIGIGIMGVKPTRYRWMDGQLYELGFESERKHPQSAPPLTEQPDEQKPKKAEKIVIRGPFTDTPLELPEIPTRSYLFRLVVKSQDQKKDVFVCCQSGDTGDQARDEEWVRRTLIHIFFRTGVQVLAMERQEHLTGGTPYVWIDLIEDFVQ